MANTVLNVPRESTHLRIAEALEGIAKGLGSLGKFKYSVIVDNGLDANPAAVEYADDCVDFIPANGSSLNDWAGLVKNYFRPCVIKPESQVPEYYLLHNNMTLKEDGTAAVTTGADGDVMIEVGKLYGQFTKISDTKFKASLMNYREKGTDICFTKFGDEEYDVAYRGAFKAGKVGGANVMRSVSGVAPWVTVTRANFRNYAKARGTGYHQNSFQLLMLWQLMYLLLYKNRNSQAALGNGWTSESAAIESMGATLSKPFCYGVPSDGHTSVKFLGCEDFYGNVWEWVDGVVLNAGVYKVTFDPAKYDDVGTSFEISEASSLTAAANNDKYIVKVAGTEKLGFLPVASGTAGAGSAAFWCDNMWVADVVQVVAFGGHWSNAAVAGAFCWALNGVASTSNAHVGSRLCRA